MRLRGGRGAVGVRWTGESGARENSLGGPAGLLSPFVNKTPTLFGWYTEALRSTPLNRRFLRQFEMLLAGGLQSQHLDQHLGRDFDLLL